MLRCFRDELILQRVCLTPKETLSFNRVHLITNVLTEISLRLLIRSLNMIMGLELAANKGVYSSINPHFSLFRPFYAAAGAAFATGATRITHADSGVFISVLGSTPLLTTADGRIYPPITRIDRHPRNCTIPINTVFTLSL